MSQNLTMNFDEAFKLGKVIAASLQFSVRHGSPQAVFRWVYRRETMKPSLSERVKVGE
jgi:hypothetical protein